MSNHAELRDQVDRLRAERDSLEKEVARLRSRDRRHTTLRGVAVGVLVTLACVTFTSATVGVWTRRSVLNSKVWAKRVEPLGKDPAVHNAMATWLTGQLMEVIEPEKLFAEVLPDKGRILAIPLENAVSGFVRDQILRFMETDTFSRLWDTAMIRAHQQAVRVITGQSRLVTGRDGQIVINFVPLINAMLGELTGVTPQLFGVSVRLPQLTVDDLPDAAQQRLSDALGLPVTGEFGIIQIDDHGSLETIQKVVRFSQAFVWVLIVVTVLLAVAALRLSERRRRTLLQLLAGIVIGMVLVRRAGFIVDRQVLLTIADPGVRAAGQSVLRGFLHPLIDTVSAIAWIVVAFGAVTLVTGPYRWARAVRSRLAVLGATGMGLARTAGSRATDETALAWMRTHAAAIQLAGVAAFVVIIATTNLGWVGTGVLLGVFALVEIGIWWLGESARRTPAVLAGTSATETSTVETSTDRSES